MALFDSTSGMYLHVDFPNAETVTFNKARVRRAFVSIGQKLLAESRRIVARRAISKAGEMPGFQSGALAKSVGFYVPRPSGSRPGFMVRIAPNQKRGKGSKPIDGEFYPAYLFYGVRAGARRNKKHKKGSSGGDGWRMAPRGNFMTQALLNKREWSETVLFNALRDSVKPGKDTGI
ncbi:hypothetical protein ACL2XG_05340 [Sodalis sp. RH24]|uniref:hypothetical protein n=1 Tax=unclassified Sodalis (in: enterobacteria) TaxID=2636512 RepID=UPI0039B62B9E